MTERIRTLIPGGPLTATHLDGLNPARRIAAIEHHRATVRAKLAVFRGNVPESRPMGTDDPSDPYRAYLHALETREAMLLSGYMSTPTYPRNRAGRRAESRGFARTWWIELAAVRAEMVTARACIRETRRDRTAAARAKRARDKKRAAETDPTAAHREEIARLRADALRAADAIDGANRRADDWTSIGRGSKSARAKSRGNV